MIQIQENQGKRNKEQSGIEQWRNQKGTRQDKSRRFTQLHSTLHTSIQQKEV